MKRTIVALCVALLSFTMSFAQTEAPSQAKLAAVESIVSHRSELIDLADQVWAFAETALRETRSAAVLADFLESEGFRVERGVAEMPTAFVATYGSGRPIIGVMGEYDALPGISQKVQTTQEAYQEGAPGHGCGHNLFGAASLGAALAVKEQIAGGKLEGTVRFYGTPAEESIGGKVYMVRAGLFEDLDAVLAWHPGTEIVADTGSSQAMAEVRVEFRGRTAHGAFDPWNGRSALDGVEMFNFGVNLMREHVKPTVRMHYVIENGGNVPNVVPDYARVWCWFRDSKHEGVDELLERARAIADGAALATGTKANFRVAAGDWESLTSIAGATLLHANMTWLGPLEFSEEEQEFAREIQRNTGVEPVGLKGEVEPLDLDPGDPEGGSTDVADVSWNVPTIHMSVTTAAHGAPWHAWPVVATGGMSIGYKGMEYAAKALATTMVDLYEKPDQLDAMRKEFEEKTEGVEYKPFIPDGPPPVPSD
jgi:aminobenzoyl-glutamate utilization protein B